MLIFTSLFLLNLSVCTASSANEDELISTGEKLLNIEEQYVEWEYEPRVWSQEEFDSTREEDLFDQWDLNENMLFQEQLEEDTKSKKIEQNPHKQHYYLDPSKVGSKLNQRQQQEAVTCDQSKVDSLEAVVCDKSRCEKFDFLWPQFDNQLVLIETTKHGMRFHRADYAFASSQRHQQTGSSRKTLKTNATQTKQVKDRVKMDLLELLKPKPSSTTTSPYSTTQQTSSSTVQPSTTTTTPIPMTFNTNDVNTIKLVTTFRLDTSRVKQTMIGFGGALSDSTCRNIKSLSPGMAKSLMEDYFGDRGLRYNIARLSIGSSDFSTTPYTNNDRIETSHLMKQQSEVKDDLEMNHFRLTSEDYEFKLPIARQAIATSRQELKLFASLWSPPIWMKNNSNIVHGYLKGDVYGPYYKAMAELMIKWLEAYKKNGINFWGLTGLNEPITGVKPFIFHNSVGITKEDYVIFFKLYLGPMMKLRGFSDVKLMMLDDNKGYAPNLVRLMLEDKEAAKYISGIAVHWYMNDEYENLNFIPKYYPDKFILATEACNGYLPFQLHALPGNWDRGVAYMLDIIKTIQKNSAGWVDWNMALDLTGGPTWAKNNLDAPIIVNAARDEYYKSPMFYALGHFSKFVEPGSKRLDFRLANAKYDYPLEAVGFYTPNGHVVIVILNANSYPIQFKIIVDRQLIRVVPIRADSFNTVVFKWKSKESP